MKKKDCLFVVLLIVIDQITKYLITSRMFLNQQFKIIEDFFYIHYVVNTGAAFSILQGNRVMFILLAVLTAGLLSVYLIKNKTGWMEKLAILLMMAGAIGNCIDRIFLGHVIDFLDFYIFGWDFPVFNFADCCITIAAGLLILDLFINWEKK